MVVLAEDRSPRTEEKVDRLARGLEVPVLVGPDAATLGQVLGRTSVQAVGVCDRQLAAGLRDRKAEQDSRRQE